MRRSVSRSIPFSRPFSLCFDLFSGLYMASLDLMDPAGKYPWESPVVGFSQPSFEVSDGVATISIPENIYASSDPLWKFYVVGYFIGDAPHVGSIHATVNRI
ncbi:Uncharacterized protein Rs2_38763 [Raphanus sativus]|nr:Uncharacterized protein Rs2_38763 [Raphanus sativus]